MPLPKPKPNETRNEFMGRCMSNTNILNDFNSTNQRYAVCNDLFSDKRKLKAFKFNYRKFKRAFKAGFRKLHKRASRANYKKAYQYYNVGFRDSVKQFLKSNDMNADNYIVFFQQKNTLELYNEIYIKTGLMFYDWYLGNYESFIKKEATTSNIFEAFIANYVLHSDRLQQRISSVKKTAIKNVINIFSKNMESSDFAQESRLGKAMILNKQLQDRALWEAKRIVVTETTLASNIAVEQAALSAFEKPEELVKDWILGSSFNHRMGHMDLDAQNPIPVGENFINPVTGNSMRIPGEGPSSEVINCSCSVAFIPNPDTLIPN